MSELETQKEQTKDLTFEEICPEWSRRIANYDNLSEEEKHNISESLNHQNSCFLGEANGFKGGWFYRGCSECDRFGGYIGVNSLCREFSSEPKTLNWTSFNEKKDAFVKHWNEKHNG